MAASLRAAFAARHLALAGACKRPTGKAGQAFYCRRRFAPPWRPAIAFAGAASIYWATSACLIATGRTSIIPSRALGIRAAHSSASLSESASMR